MRPLLHVIHGGSGIRAKFFLLNDLIEDEHQPKCNHPNTFKKRPPGRLMQSNVLRMQAGWNSGKANFITETMGNK